MADKKPIRTVFNDSNVATGLAEFQTGETVGLAHGGLGAALSIGSAGQVLKVNTGGTALEFGAVEAIINIDTATNLTGQTLASTDQLMVSDGGTEGRATLSQIQAAIKDTTATLTNKTIAAGSNTISGLTNSNLSGSAGITNANLANSTINFGGVSLALGASDTTPAFDLSDATAYPTSSLTGTITNAQLAGSIAASKLAGSIGNSKLSNSTVTIGTTAIALGASNTTIAGISNLTAGGINITGNSITSADSSIIEMGEGLSVTGNLTVSGNFTVAGTTTTVSSTNTTLADQFIELGTGRTGSATGDAGIVIERGNDANAIIGFDESANEFTVGTGTFTGSSSGDLTITKGAFSSAANRIYNGANYVELVSPSLGGNVVLTLPANDGDTNQLLSTDGSGNLSFISATAASGAGLSNVSDDTSPTLGGDLDADSKIIKNIKLLDHDLLGASYGPSSAPVTITITVASKTAAHPYNGDGSSSAYFLNGIESPAIQLHGADNVTSDSGYYYRFDQADSSNGGHPLRFYLDADKTTAYTTGVTTNGTPGSAGAYTQIDVDEDTPSILYYQCSSHAYMGNYALVPASNKINHTEALISMPTTTGTLVGTGDTGTVTNDMLAGSIATSKLAGSITNAKLSNSTITIRDDSSTSDAVALGETLIFEGGSGVTTTVTDNKVSIATDGSIVTETSTDTLTNKTLTSPVLNTGVSGTAIKDEDNMASDSNTHLATQQSIKAYVDSQILTKDNTDEIAEGSTNLYFTNARADARITNAIKDEDNMASNSDTHIPSQQSVKAYVDATVTAQDLDFQGDSGGALNIDLDSEVLDIAGGTGIDTTGSGNTLTVAIDATVSTLTGTQTLTNKTLTSPKINEDVVMTATATQLNHSVGVTAAIQTQLDSKTTPAFAIAQAVALG